MLNRRQLLQGAGAVVVANSSLVQIAQAFGFLPRAESQTISQQSTERTYKSGDTIETFLGPFKIDGWTVTYPSHAVADFETKKPGARANYRFYSNMSEGISYVYSGDFSRDLSKGIEAQIFLPTYYHHEVLLEITNNGKPTIYRISLQPNISPEAPGIVSEIPIDNAILNKLSDVVSSFRVEGQLFINDPYPIYILKRDTPRVAYFDIEQKHVEMPSGVVTNPRFENESQMLLFDALARQLAVRNSIDPNQRPHIQLFESYLRLVETLGFRPTWTHIPFSERYGQQTKKHLFTSEGQEEAAKNPNFSIFHALSYIPSGQGSDTSITASYIGDLGLFVAALTVFRFFPKEFMTRYNNDTSIRKDLVKPPANAVLDSLEARMPNPDDTSVVNGRKKRDEDILRLTPAFYELRSALAK